MNQILLKTTGEMLYGQNLITRKPQLFLGYPVFLDKDYTFRHFFQLLETYPILADLNPFFSSYLEMVRACPASGCHCDFIDWIELNRTVEMIGFPGQPRMTIYSSLVGIQKNRPLEIKPYGLNNLLDLPLKLGKLKHVVFGDTVDEFEFETVFNLFDIIDGIAWELSFHNMPKECRISL
ncbi:MAG: hypothetical protein ACOZF0_17680 [Thermodesulfobacteriota bacterium]